MEKNIYDHNVECRERMNDGMLQDFLYYGLIIAFGAIGYQIDYSTGAVAHSSLAFHSSPP